MIWLRPTITPSGGTLGRPLALVGDVLVDPTIRPGFWRRLGRRVLAIVLYAMGRPR